MNIERIYHKLDSDDTSDNKRFILVNYLKEEMSRLPQSDSERAEVAYSITGLLSTQYAMSLDSREALEEILSLAGELEIQSPENEQKWLTMQHLIAQLSDSYPIIRHTIYEQS